MDGQGRAVALRSGFYARGEHLRLSVGESKGNRSERAGSRDKSGHAGNGERRGGVEGNAAIRRLGSGSGAACSRSQFLGGGPLKITSLNVPAPKRSAASAKASASASPVSSQPKQSISAAPM